VAEADCSRVGHIVSKRVNSLSKRDFLKTIKTMA